MKSLQSFTLAFAACLALAATPALAQNAPDKAPMPMSGAKSGGAMPMKGMKMAKPGKMGMKTAMMKRSCMDYAWQSQDQKDCEAGSKKPPTNR